MAEIDVKRGAQGNPQGSQTTSGRPSPSGGAASRDRGESGEALRRTQGSEGGRPGLASTRGRSGGGLSRETGAWGWSRSPLSISPMDLWSLGPFELMRRMSDEMDRMLQAGTVAGTTAGGNWVPAVEVAERDGTLVITAELPGLSQEDVRVEATDEGLVIEGERKREHEETSGGVYRSERSYGYFRRVIPLPDDAQLEQAQARFTNGMLEVTVPLSQENARRRRIPISTGGESTGAQTGAGGSASASGTSSTATGGPTTASGSSTTHNETAGKNRG